MLLTDDQKRPVLAIDLGASHTKLAWRPGWTESTDQPLAQADHFFKSPSNCLEIDGELHIPSIALQTGSQHKWVYGTEAAKLTPLPGTAARVNWKSVLFDKHPHKQELDEAIDVAKGFLNWLYSHLSKRSDLEDFNKCAVVLCVPALAERITGFDRIKKAWVDSEWQEHPISESLEPRANIVGLASTELAQDSQGKYKARNHITFTRARGIGKEFWADIGQIFGQNSPLISWARDIGQGAPQKKVGVIDIGAFTTDFAVCELNSQGEVKISGGAQRSIRHGVASLDRKLKTFLADKGLNTNQITHLNFSLAKVQIYGGNEYMVSDGQKNVLVRRPQSLAWVESFTQEILGEIETQTSGWKAFVLTGGGAKIPLVRDALTEALTDKGLRNLQDSFQDIDTRIATAAGAASVELQKWNAYTAPAHPVTPNVVTPPPAGRNCTCGGLNPSCNKCDGDGWIKALPNPARTRGRNKPRVEDPPPPSAEAKPPIEMIPRLAPTRKRANQTVRSATPKFIAIANISAGWAGHELEAKMAFGLEGWLGELVFENTKLQPKEQAAILRDASSVTGKSTWMRLLCLCACLGVRAKPTYIETFWEKKLPDVWNVLIPRDLAVIASKHYDHKLNEVFVAAIHREFNSRNTRGEDAELWRRVFYDFRKLHHYVYINELPCSLLELAAEPGLQEDTLVNFMKSGSLPNRKPWVGVIGQSMTAPLLFLMRELRRLEIIDARFDASCWYMNTPARRVASQLGWITERQAAQFDIENVIEISRTCHARMKQECPELLPFYDLPLQWYSKVKKLA